MRFRNALWEIVRFEAVWKLAVLCLFHPLFRGLFQTYVSASGLIACTRPTCPSVRRTLMPL